MTLILALILIAAILFALFSRLQKGYVVGPKDERLTTREYAEKRIREMGRELEDIYRSFPDLRPPPRDDREDDPERPPSDEPPVVIH
jgi:hypothetical protein